MKKTQLIKSTIAAVAIAINFLCFAAYGQSNQLPNLPPDCQVLFVQVAKSAQLAPSKTQPGTYNLTLKTVEPFTSYFTDRPNRLTGLLTTNTFVNIWQSALDIRKNPPNVAMETSNTRNGQRINQVLELSNPSYDAKNHQITYVAKSLNNAALQPMTMGYTVLFIDDFHWHGDKIGG